MSRFFCLRKNEKLLGCSCRFQRLSMPHCFELHSSN